MPRHAVVVITSIVSVVVVRHRMATASVQHEPMLDLGAVPTCDVQAVFARWNIHARRTRAGAIGAGLRKISGAESRLVWPIHVDTGSRQSDSPAPERSWACHRRKCLGDARRRVLTSLVAWWIAEGTVTVVIVAAQIRGDGSPEDSGFGMVCQIKGMVIVASVEGARSTIADAAWASTSRGAERGAIAVWHGRQNLGADADTSDAYEECWS